MIGNDGREPGADLLAEMIGALVEGAAPRGVPTVPEANLPLVRRAVRVRRVVKAGGVTAATLAVAGMLAIAASALPDRTTPIPPATPSASPTPSDTGLAIVDGHVPPGWEGSGLSCGMPTADLPGEVDLQRLTLTGPAISHDVLVGSPPRVESVWRWSMNSRGDGVTPGLEARDPVVVWAQDGRVVGLGTLAGDPVWHAQKNPGTSSDVADAATSTCARSAVVGGTAPPLPPGSYQVVALMELRAPSGSETARYLRSEPVPVVVGSDGRLSTPDDPVEASVKIDLPEAPPPGTIAWAWADHSGALWEAAHQQVAYVTEDSTLTLRGRCSASQPKSQIAYTVVEGGIPVTSHFAAGPITCDGTMFEVPVHVPVEQGTAGRSIVVQLSLYTDVARAWVTLGP